jgi:hypothetical protein
MNRDFAEMLSALSAAGAEFLIVGAHAVAAHGHPPVEGQTLPFIGRNELLVNKRAVGRPKDLGDIAFLEDRDDDRR